MTDHSHVISQIQSHLYKALDLWRIVTGVDLESTKLLSSTSHLRETFDLLQEAIDLDPSGVTAALLLNHYASDFLASQTFSYATLIADPEAVAKKLAPCQELMSVLEHDSIKSAQLDYENSIRSALEHYGASKRSDIQELIADGGQMAMLRRDALRSMSRLRVDQFLSGTYESESIKPVYAKSVYNWWNINSLLATSAVMPSGVALNMIRHPHAYQSYFAFSIRCGGNLFTLSDVPDQAHPLQGYMSRRPERTLDRRVSQNWLPYDLLGVDYDDEDGELFLRRTHEKALVAYQAKTVPLKPVEELGPYELVWLIMMFDLIIERFWHKQYQAPALSYTAEMLKQDTVLLTAAENAGLPVVPYKPVGLQPLTPDDVRHTALSEADTGKMGVGENQWLENRYGHKVSIESLNAVSDPHTQNLLEIESGKVTTDAPESDAERKNQVITASPTTTIQAVNSGAFGSREQLDADRKFIARFNFAKQVKIHAVDEFNALKEEVLNWYKERVSAHSSQLLPWVGNETLWVEHGPSATFEGYRDNYYGPTCVVGRDQNLNGGILYHGLLKIVSLKADSWALFNTGDTATLGEVSNGDAFCAITGAKTTSIAIFYPVNADELALLTGVEKQELPDVLQHWNLHRPYTGNSILQRIDPMAWVAEDPWRKLDLRIRVPVSKRGLAALRKVKTVPAFPRLTVEVPGSMASD
ncbi:TPA: hypothetical protein L4559_003540 [Pseudomonas aeruginosa]|nr:hypothetical protein [Pseudomonas aeruginosa]